jgi:hypothetical protein
MYLEVERRTFVSGPIIEEDCWWGDNWRGRNEGRVKVLMEGERCGEIVEAASRKQLTQIELFSEELEDFEVVFNRQQVTESAWSIN